VSALALIWITIASAIVLGAVVLAVNLRARDLNNATDNLATDALMLSAHLENAFTMLEAVQEGILEQLHGEGIGTENQFVATASSLPMHRTLLARIAALPYVGGITLIERRGILVNSTYYWPMPFRDLSDREYFHILSKSELNQRYVTKPLQNRANGQWTIYVARRVEGVNGIFLGILLGEINFDHFRGFFSQVAPQPDAVVSMFDLDGVMLVRHPAVTGTIGTSPPTGARQLLQNGSDHGTLRSVSPIDGQDRVAAVHRLPHYPMVVSMSRRVDAVLETWRAQVRYIVVVAAVLEAALAGIMLLGLRQMKGRQRLADLEASLVRAEMERALAEESDRNERALATEYARFNVAVNAMNQGLCMFDRNHRLIVSNPHFAKLFALPPDVLVSGSPLSSIVRRAVRLRSVSLADIRRLKSAVTPAPDGPSAVTMPIMWDIADGRSLSVNQNRMPDQGWLMTFSDATERRRTEAQIAHMARHDGLTGLANRLLFNERLSDAVKLAARGTPHALMCLDLDHFKTVNDTLGHPVGDALLQAVTARLRRCCREVDLIARLGGDEFAIIMPQASSAQEAAPLAERLIAELSLPFDLMGHQAVIGSSIGIAFTPGDGSDAETLLKCADLALYKAKADGRNCFRFFEPAMDAALHQRQTLESDMRQAFACREFLVFYQPLIDTKSESVRGFEALLRWPRSDGTFVGPDQFIPVAEEMGLIVPLGGWVLETACQEAMSWPSHIAVAVNISPAQFRSRTFIETVRGALEESGLSPDRLELEITEGLLLHDVAETVATLHQLRDLGLRVSMDDFGTGYSSLSYLLKFPFDKVKLDRSFMTDLGNGGHRDVIVTAVTAMCDALGMQTVGEGVETQAQLSFLKEHNCAEVQGFLFSRAVPASQIPGLLEALDHLSLVE
jgi:diguanylate cyclase (GGDEF)-like protein